MTFEDYVSALGPVRRVVDAGDVAEHAVIQQAAEALTAMATVDRESLAELVQVHPDWVPTLGLAAGLSQEGLKNLLKHRLDTSGWITLARQRPSELIQALDEDRGLVAELEAQRARAYTFGDVLVARASSRQSAGTAIAGGRAVEDAIEKVVLGARPSLRTAHALRGAREANCTVRRCDIGWGRRRQDRLCCKGIRFDWQQVDRCRSGDRVHGRGPASKPIRLRGCRRDWLEE